MFKFIRNMFKKEKRIVIPDNERDMIFIDPGASSFKVIVNGRKINYRASVLEVDNMDEIVTQENYICVNDKWYSVADTDVPTDKETLKHNKENWIVLFLYGMVLFNKELDFGNIKINMVLPFNQLKYKINFKKVLESRKWSVKTTNGVNFETDLTLMGVYPEGYMSKYYIEQIYDVRGHNLIISNIGFSTWDNAAFNSMGSTAMEPLPIATAIRNLFIDHNKIIGLQDSMLLNDWYSEGYEPLKEDIHEIKRYNKLFINRVMTDLYTGMLARFNPCRTWYVTCGGGSSLIGDDLKEWIKKDRLISRFKVLILTGDDATYTDILGTYLYVTSGRCDNRTNNINCEVKEITPIIEETPIEGVKEQITPIKKSNTRLDYKVLVPKVLEIYDNKPTLTELQNEFNISKQQARTLISKCF